MNKLSTEPYTSWLESKGSNPSNELFFARRAIESLTAHYNALYEDYEKLRKASISLPLFVSVLTSISKPSKKGFFSVLTNLFSNKSKRG